ncbi:multi antimicrobial extrusion protein MatE [Halobacillus salinarum]|uniref:Multi antimicrobial extrusion protein MatE n=1 Tax=Halobacillus salinarum TaxID=2932257 RepID=A0ABY4EIR0_9BACI|nr:multi antimicrobial extrusion protein MatE [Halobacillus salinarum]UOQ43981.1 multi antimicrobial extrusion protein MatE [Halobacillus salinarum]
MTGDTNRLTYRHLAGFFIPLGISGSLTSITHVIINGTLSRGDNATFIIACYAVAFALFGIIERPIIVFRQTSSALVHDQSSFRMLSRFMMYALGIIVAVSLIMIYTSAGSWVYIRLFQADQSMVETISNTFKIIVFVIILSGIRGIYQGVIINRFATKWISIMVVIRLAVMFLAAYLFVTFQYITSATGAILFLTGMFVECLMSIWKGHALLKPASSSNKHHALKKREIFNFYLPLVFYFVVQTVVVPIIYVFLAKTDNIEMGIASFALAFSITQMLLSFFMYTHQLVLQLYLNNKQKVVKFMIILSILPSILLAVLCFTPAGLWFMQTVMGADMELSVTTLGVLKFFMIKTLVFPWVDFLNGFLMLYRNTGKMMVAQVVNLATVIGVLMYFVLYHPEWNGKSGSLAASVGELAGLILVAVIVVKMLENKRRGKEKRYAASGT